MATPHSPALQKALHIALLSLLLLGCGGKGSQQQADTAMVEEPVPTDTVQRCSITFIMGEDRSAANPYYSLAGFYYRLSAKDRTDRVVDNLASLSEVIKYLNANPAPDSCPYGVVNLVCHGNGFVDLEPTVTRNGKRISVASLQEAMKRHRLPMPDSAVVDSLTIIHLHGCGIGNNRPLLKAMRQAFGDRPRVVASKLFECYIHGSANHNPQNIIHYYAYAWYAFQNPDSTPSTAQLAKQFKKRYPHEHVDWQSALSRSTPSSLNEPYHFSYIVPCRYEEIYGTPQELPPLNSRKQRLQWEADNADFQQLLASTGIERQYYRVRFYRQTYASGDSLLWGIKVKAHAGVVCVLKPLVTTDSTTNAPLPLHPPLGDTAVFSVADKAD
ncbi:MAG: hypothetical protein IJU81_07755 [Bacteroidales bacterium]|nr:hypothetical protein [Bacteroidales bacterium]